MARTKIPAEFSSTPGIVDNSTVTAITIDSAGAATFGGNVGIGVSTPNEKLESSGAIRVLGTTATSRNSGTLSFNGTLFNIESRGPDVSNRGTIGFYQATSSGSSAIQSMLLDASGNLTTTGAATFGGTATATQFSSTSSNASLPSFGVSAGNGMYNAGTNILGFSTNSLNRMTLDSSGNVGIGTSDPKSTLEVKGTFSAPATSGSASGFISRFSQTSGAGSLDFGFGNPYSWMQSRASNNYSVNYALALNPNGGNVGIGITDPGAKLTINAPAADRETIRLQTYYSPVDNLARGGITWHDGSSVTGQIDTRYNGTTVDMHLGHLYNLGYNTASKVIIKGNGNVEIPDGNLSFAAGHGIDFSATANAGGTSNATSSEILDDYEEGTWYPYLGTETQLGGASSGNYNNRYVKIGRFVHCTGWFNTWNWANVTSGTYIMIRNLPFPPEMHSTGLRLSYASNLGGSTYGYGHTSLSAFYLLIGGSTGASTHYTRAAAPTSGTAHAMLNITYYTDS